MLRTTRSALVGLALAGCAPSPQAGDLQTRAGYDMNCSDRTDIRVRELGNDTYDAEGCGKHARYAWVCKGHGPMAPCQWKRFPESKPAASAESR